MTVIIATKGKYAGAHRAHRSEPGGGDDDDHDDHDNDEDEDG